jgi:hypothetical protein
MYLYFVLEYLYFMYLFVFFLYTYRLCDNLSMSQNTKGQMVWSLVNNII